MGKQFYRPVCGYELERSMHVYLNFLLYIIIWVHL